MKSKSIALLLLVPFVLAPQTTTKVDYPTQVKNGPFFSDAGPIGSTLQSLCATVGTGTLTITKQWPSLATQTIGCSLEFAGGTLQPASGQTVTMSRNSACPDLQKCYDLSLGGAVILPAGQYVTPQNFGGVADGNAAGTGTDNSTYLQACFAYAEGNAAGSCYIPGGNYNYATGLTLTSGEPAIWGISGAQNGNGFTDLIYTNTGTGLEIGNGSARLFGVTLTNIGITAANNKTASVGIVCQNYSGASTWTGVTVGGGGTSGYFTTAMRFSDCGAVRFQNLTISNQSYQSSATGMLFDQYSSYGNSNIAVDGFSQIVNFGTGINFKSCITCTFQNMYFENNDYSLLMDNTSAFSNNSGIDQVVFDKSEFNTSGSGPTHHKILQVNSTTGNFLPFRHMVISASRWYMAGGVSEPIYLNASSVGAFSFLNLDMRDNICIGCNTAIVYSASGSTTLPNLNFSGNVFRDASGNVRVPDVVGGLANVNDANAQNSSIQFLNITDQSGVQLVAGSSGNTMSRPALNYYGPGVMLFTSQGDQYNGDGWGRWCAGGGAPAYPATTIGNTADITCSEWMGFNSTTGMYRKDMVGTLEVMSLTQQLTTAGAGHIVLSAVPVASLPGCGGGNEGDRASVTDANSTTFNASAVGGGSNHMGVRCNGTAWVID